MRLRCIVMTGLVVSLLLAGCTAATEERPATGNDSATEEDEPGTGDVAVAPASTRITVGQATQMHYRGQTLHVSTSRNSTAVTVTARLGSRQRTVVRALEADGRTVSRSLDNLQLVVTPVRPEQRGNQTVFTVTETWETTTVTVEVFCRTDC